MFGVLRYAGCGLDPQLRQAWRGHICGVCVALRRDYGPLAGIAANYDAALLGALYEAQVEREPLKRKRSCLLRGPGQVWTTDPGNPGARYSAGMALLIAASKVEDDLHDGEIKLRPLAGAVRRLVKDCQTAARTTFAALGLSADSIVVQIERQRHFERQLEQPFDFYARPTELAVGTAFANTATLALRPENAAALDALGRAYGRIMFLLDSYRDYAADRKAGRFNPLAVAYPAVQDRAQVARLFQQAEATLRASFSQLTLQRPDLLDALLLHQLRRTGYRTLGPCQEASVCRFERSRPVMAHSEESGSAGNGSESPGSGDAPVRPHRRARKRRKSAGESPSPGNARATRKRRKSSHQDGANLSDDCCGKSVKCLCPDDPGDKRTRECLCWVCEHCSYCPSGCVGG